MARRVASVFGVLAALAVASQMTVARSMQAPAAAPQEPPVDHGRRVLDLLVQEKFADVAKEFNAPVAAAMSAERLGEVWAMLRMQVGAFTSVIDQSARPVANGATPVVIGCQFERAALNVLIAFDGDQKIAGLRFMPRPADPQAPPAAPPPSSRFTEEAVTVGGGEWALPGALSLPTGETAAAVVLVHGSGPNDRDETVGANKPFRDLAWGLANRGIAVLRYEKRTRQHAARIASIPNFTVREEVIEDAVLAVARLRAHARLAQRPVFVLGHSLGGTLAPRIAAEDSSIAGLIILAGATRPLEELAREQLEYLGSLTPSPLGSTSPDDAIRSLRRAAPESYWKDLDAYKPADAAARLAVPMLILQGERDYQVTMKDLEGWRTALSGRERATIKTYPTLNHLFIAGDSKSTPAEYQQPGHVAEVVLDDISAWLKDAARVSGPARSSVIVR